MIFQFIPISPILFRWTHRLFIVKERSEERRVGTWSTPNSSLGLEKSSTSLLKEWNWDTTKIDERKRQNPTGCFQSIFEVPEKWNMNGNRTFIVFEGVDSDRKSVV